MGNFKFRDNDSDKDSDREQEGDQYLFEKYMKSGKYLRRRPKTEEEKEQELLDED